MTTPADEDDITKTVRFPRPMHDAAQTRARDMMLRSFSEYIVHLVRSDLETHAPHLLPYAFTPRRVVTSYEPAPNITPLPRAAENAPEERGKKSG